MLRPAAAVGRPKRRGGGRVTPKKSRPRYDDGRGADAVYLDGDYLYETQIQAEPPRSRSATDCQLELLSRDAAHLIEEVSGADGPDMLGRTMLGFAMMCHDRDILRWTPPRVSSFLEDWLADHGLFCEECGESHEHPPDEEWLSTVESAFPRWLRYAAERGKLPDDALEANLAAARESLKRMRRHATGSPLRLA